jgi:hypothetical protein
MPPKHRVCAQARSSPPCLVDQELLSRAPCIPLTRPGEFPPKGQNPTRVVVPTGSGPVVITMTANAADGSPVITTFSR